jgi:hypothetical protein
MKTKKQKKDLSIATGFLKKRGSSAKAQILMRKKKYEQKRNRPFGKNSGNGWIL